ncbi:serpin family protein [Endozoicomonas sp. ALC020]|uniref:serpin family protein n=1 Tax=unclassified Endozoicomonas TaxID=2644528 RepID=UPI003BB115B6
MAQVMKSPDIALQHRRILLLVSLLYFLLLPSQLWAAPYDHFGNNENPGKSSPYPVFHEEVSGDELQGDTMPYQSVTPENPDPDPGTRAAESKQDLELAISVFSQAAKAKETPENFLFSPDGLFRSLVPVLMGASGETRRLLQSYMGDNYSEPSPAEATTTSSAQDDYFVSNTVLLSEELEIKEAYRGRVKEVNLDVREKIRFDDGKSLESLADELNELFSKLTHGMIPKFCSPREWSADTTLGLISSIYFNALWRDSFQVGMIGLFTLPGVVNKVILDKWLQGEISSSQYTSHEHWQAVKVPYRGTHEMVLVLPPEGIMPHEISAEIIMTLFSSLNSEESCPSCSKISIGLPPFKVDSDMELSNYLRETPLRPVFTGVVFRGTSPLELGDMLLSDPRAASINFVRQHCAIEVNEAGTRAAAVTRTGTTRSFGRGGHDRKSVQFNRPFLYFLIDEETGRILFIGQILDPRSTSGSGTGSH